jgi:hypothetical protein
MTNTPGENVKKMCMACCGIDVFNTKIIAVCEGDKSLDPCPLFPHRFGKGRAKAMTLRKYCLQCMGGSTKGVRECEDMECPLWEYRLGKNPNYVNRNPPQGGTEALKKYRTVKNLAKI